MLKTGLNIAQFKQHVTLIEEETKEYFKAWGESGERSKQHQMHCHLDFLARNEGLCRMQQYVFVNVLLQY